MPAGAPAGVFTLFEKEAAIARAGADQEALVLHTSGTTSRPKVVPLLQRNILASTRNIAASLELTAADHCLNIMPLFHIHGLSAVLATSLGVGASVCCGAGFNALKFFDLARTEQITWYSGVPTMRAGHPDARPAPARGGARPWEKTSRAACCRRRCSSSTATFGCPVIEAYGI